MLWVGPKSSCFGPRIPARKPGIFECRWNGTEGSNQFRPRRQASGARSDRGAADRQVGKGDGPSRWPCRHCGTAAARSTTGASSFASSCEPIRWFGAATFAAVAPAYAFYVSWFISVWCLFAAVLSATILLRFLCGAPRKLPGRARATSCAGAWRPAACRSPEARTATAAAR